MVLVIFRQTCCFHQTPCKASQVNFYCHLYYILVTQLMTQTTFLQGHGAKCRLTQLTLCHIQQPTSRQDSNNTHLQNKGQNRLHKMHVYKHVARLDIQLNKRSPLNLVKYVYVFSERSKCVQTRPFSRIYL